ncbi:hypothetical protein CAEBREN_05193 [Caenorhabditis brenneri]|uniref:Uncharacterized protein n=1 Tax=Caenorhabditis brenneri TaxID=135651 RepID=G0NNU8_CAEBE|nr:hypothetical protein CAEBREN_05193 [Caenorhabditis brenneri]
MEIVRLLDGLKDTYGPLNLTNKYILDVNRALEDLGELRIFHKADGRIETGRIQLSFFDSSRHLGRRHGRMEVLKWYMERGIHLRRPYDRLVYVEGPYRRVYAVEQILII